MRYIVEPSITKKYINLKLVEKITHYKVWDNRGYKDGTNKRYVASCIPHKWIADLLVEALNKKEEQDVEVY